MSMSDLDMHRAAHMLIKKYGDGAAESARQRVAKLEAMGEPEGAAVYQRIVAAIIALQDPPSATVN